MRQRYSDFTQLEVIALDFHSTLFSPHCDNRPIGIGWAQLNCSSCENIFLSCIEKHSTIRVSECVTCNSNWKWRILWQTFPHESLPIGIECKCSPMNEILNCWRKKPTQIYLDVNTKRECSAAAAAAAVSVRVGCMRICTRWNEKRVYSCFGLPAFTSHRDASIIVKQMLFGY